MDRRRPRFLRIVITAVVPAVALFTGLGLATTATASTTPAATQRAEAAAIARAAIKNLVVGFEHSPTAHKVSTHSTGVKGLSQVESTNWSGYADTGSSFSKVSADWTEPTGTCSGRTESLAAFWVGIDGYSSSTVEQDGTIIECYEGTAYYYDWWEIYPENDVQVVNDVSPGNSIAASVVRSGDSYTLAVTDSSDSADSFSTTQTYSGAADSSAEWIAEAPCCVSGDTVYPLTDFHSWTSSSSDVTEGSTSGTISSFTDDEITMIDNSDAVKAQPGSLNSSGNSFAVTWERAS
jgi:hypothetical protein